MATPVKVTAIKTAQQALIHSYLWRQAYHCCAHEATATLGSL